VLYCLGMLETLTAAECLRLRRERAGLSQYQVQQKLRISRSNQLSLIETNKELPDAALAKRIERLFKIPASAWSEDRQKACA
jgi:transcriptional regulator with XRE-family HTH domain